MFHIVPLLLISGCCGSWHSILICNTLSNSKNIRTQECRAGTLRPNASLSGDQLKSPTQEEKSVLWDQSESFPEVQGQRWIQGLINHESVWMQRSQSSREYTFLSRKKKRHNSQLKQIHCSWSYHVVSPKSYGSDECGRIPARNQDVPMSDSHKKTIKRISFRGRGIELAVGVMVRVGLTLYLLQSQ